MKIGHVQILRAEKAAARPSVMKERKTSNESRVFFDTRDSELVSPFGGEGLAGDVSLVQGSNILPFPLELSIEDPRSENPAFMILIRVQQRISRHILYSKRLGERTSHIEWSGRYSNPRIRFGRDDSNSSPPRKGHTSFPIPVIKNYLQ